ncbi:hypothetical protein M747DRAFT_350253 [Aspergillus niger ATCC 13496]|uniref:Contig An04c0090, genomic contig n=3 Tax=Aspergillus niger TaxID=5061 RepID=A5AAI9_ASPNC|nr:uncharacterized protein An04g01380 [Aspergillus niger]RDH21029.1 hypothetical protein M747DRAFT_350253 [Aspergillus niger ATCC 13496]CAK47899.1 unnamed protein product [Aspergillus niger]|eukprot:XP_001401503.1 hypothetical protein ANI_1_1602184 [Aspergillus niger CBS 513.88]
MDPNTSDRLKRLQMENLGTARREYISTADDRRHKKARLEDIQAIRMTNVPGSAAQRMATVNQGRLEDWANVHKTIGDTEDLENLDSLLDGQSHRLQLSAIIRESGGQKYIGSQRRSGSAPATRSLHPVGRGGGVIGTRGRGTRQSSLPPSNPTPRGHVTQPPKRSHGDAALDDNDFYRTAREGNASRKEEAMRAQNRRSSVRRPTSSTTRPRRPVSQVDYSSMLSQPQSFLAAARSLVSARTTPAAPTPASQISRDGGRSEASRKSSSPMDTTDRPTVQKTQQEPKPQMAEPPKPFTRPVVQLPAIPPRCTAVQQESTTKADEPLPVLPSSAVLDATSQDQGSASMSLGSTEDGQSISGIPESQTGTQEKVNSDLSTAAAPVPDIKDTSPKAATDVKEAILLDFSYTPPEQSIHGQSPAPTEVLTPSLEDLRGLDFKQDIHPKFPTRRRVDFDMSSDKREASTNVHDLMPTKQYDKAEASEDLHRQINMLCELLQSTSLSGEHRESLKQCKTALEGKLHGAYDSTGKRTQTQGDPFLGKPVLETLEAAAEPDEQPQSTISGLGIQNVSMDNFTPNKAETIVEPDTQATPSVGEMIMPTSVENARLAMASPSPSSRLNVTAPPFVPKTPFRAQSNSFSSDSNATCVPETPCPHRRVSMPEGHIIGDHLLPGRRRETISSGTEPLAAKQPPANEVTEPRFKFSIPPKISRKLTIKTPVREGFGKEETPGPVAPRLASGNIPKPAPKPSAALQQSVHAPKAKPSSVLGGLESSRYASPSSNKPFR